MTTIRICPERDRPCPHGMDCPFVVDRYNCSDSLVAPAASIPQPEGETDDVANDMIAGLGKVCDNLTTRAEVAEARIAAVEAERDEARKQAGDYERLLADAYETASEEMDRAESAEAQLAHAREVLEQVLSVEQCPHPIGDLVNDPDPSAKKCWESGACGCVYGAGFAAIRALGGGK